MRRRPRIVKHEWTITELAIVVKYVGAGLLVTDSVPVVAAIGSVGVARSRLISMLCPVCDRGKQPSSKEYRQESDCVCLSDVPVSKHGSCGQSATRQNCLRVLVNSVP